MVQVAAALLLLYGLSPKLGALLVLIPRPVVGAVFLVGLALRTRGTGAVAAPIARSFVRGENERSSASHSSSPVVVFIGTRRIVSPRSRASAST